MANSYTISWQMPPLCTSVPNYLRTANKICHIPRHACSSHCFLIRRYSRKNFCTFSNQFCAFSE